MRVRWTCEICAGVGVHEGAERVVGTWVKVAPVEGACSGSADEEGDRIAVRIGRADVERDQDVGHRVDGRGIPVITGG